MASILLRILFIGNSLTAGNNLPAVLEALAPQAGVTVEAEMVAFPDHSLEDHWNRPEARRAIASRRWDFVVLQQGPSTLAESRRLLRQYTKLFDGEIRKTGARTALYAVWPASMRLQDLPHVHNSYVLAAEDVDGLLLPVGKAWLAAWRRDKQLKLYGPDGFHPSALGTYLAALVMLQALTGHSVVGIPSPFSSIDPPTVRVLQEAASEAVGRISP